ncbi:hypothetical protein SCA6_018790 [Theobroma cacao]
MGVFHYHQQLWFSPINAITHSLHKSCGLRAPKWGFSTSIDSSDEEEEQAKNKKKKTGEKKFQNQDMNMELDHVVKFLQGKTILVTGATGFLAKSTLSLTKPRMMISFKTQYNLSF